MNKTERRSERLEKHYAILERLSEHLGKKQDGKKLSLALWKLETRAHKAATDYCNGDIGPEMWEAVKEEIHQKIFEAFGHTNVPGFFVNGDPRGYALKIDDAEGYIREVGMERDWGGYGILSPEINGEA